MKHNLLIIVLVLSACSVYASMDPATAGRQVKAYLEAKGQPSGLDQFTVEVVSNTATITKWNATVAKPTEADLSDPSVLALPVSDRKVEGDKWVAKTSGEKVGEDLVLNGGTYAYQNAFLMICDTLTATNTHAKLSFRVIPTYLKPLKKSDRDQFDALKDALSTINMALVESAGTKWWTTCVWTEHPTVISNATVILNTMLTP